MIKIFLFIIFFFNFNYALSDTKIAYIDMQFIFKESLIGNSFEKQISSYADKEIISLKEKEKSIIDKEKNLLSQKNILKKDEFDKKVISLQDEIKNFRLEKTKFENKVKNDRINYTKKIIEVLNPLIAKYVEDNSISLVFPKKSVLIGKKNLDITNDIVKSLNEKIKEIKDLNNEN